MSIRLNKALRELNIGLQTAVEFLEKKNHLGEVKAEPSFKLNDEQYNALVNEFKQDAEVRSQAEKLFQKKTKDKKREPSRKETHADGLLKSSTQQQYKPLGKMDLDNIGKKPAEKSAAPVAQPEPAETKEAPKAEAKPVETKPETVAVGLEEVKVETAIADKKTEVAQPEAPIDKEEKDHPEPVHPQEEVSRQQTEDTAGTVAESETSAASEKPELFTLKSERKLSANEPKVLGKIDLATLNQSTRPKKKSKEERRKEREEKAQQGRGGNAAGGERKKRQRINKERVDINAAANQQQAGGGGKNSGKKNKGKKRNQKPLEVNEEDVARQVKETLARLTNKQNQNRKGAKYRKEKREAVQEKLAEEANAERKQSKTLKLTEFVTVSELATMMGVGVNQVIGTLMGIGIMVSINQRLDAETINLVADEFGFKTEYVSAEVSEAVSEEEDDENDLVPRARRPW